VIESSQIEKMSVTERLQAMDQLWDSLTRDGDEIPSPDWHQEVLAHRKARAQRGEAKFLTLDQLRSRLRSFEP
jgi:putative addiction module component (TIGR02574 family)